MRWARLIAAFIVPLCAVRPDTVSAHPAQFTTLQVMVDAGGRFQAELNIDILAFALGETSLAATNEEMQALLDGPRELLGKKLAHAADRFRDEVVIRTDAGNINPGSWDVPGLPEVTEVLSRKIQPPILMPGEIEFSGTLPAAAHTLSIRLPYVLGDTMQVFELPGGDSDAAPVAAGAFSDAVHLNLQTPELQPKVAALPHPGAAGIAEAVSKALMCLVIAAGLFLLGSRLLRAVGKAGVGH